MTPWKPLTFTAALGAAIALSAPAFAGGHITWKSVPDQSIIAFGSVKKDTIGEVHHFNSVSGEINEAGEITLTIDLASLETNIDIRNERMMEHVFQKGSATATVTGELDMDDVSDLAIGDVDTVDIEATLAFAGTELEVEAEMLVARLTENRVLVTSADFMMISTEDLGINAGVDMLQKLAKLPGITRVTPISVRMVFEK